LIYEREFFAHGSERWVLRLDRQLLGLSVVRYVDQRQDGAGVPFEEFFAMGTGPAHKAFVEMVESLVPQTAEFEVT
jgi:hypothetical protein